MKRKIIKINNPIAWPIIINGLTIFRLILGLPLIITLTINNYNIFVLLMLLGGVTDFLDGYLARKYNFQSTFGAWMDPLADKIFLLGPMIWLVHENLVPLWAIWLLLSREFLITSWRTNKSTGGPASIQAKYKTILQFISIILLLWPEDWGNIYYINILNKIGYISFWLSFILTFSSAFKYVFNQKESHQH